jgi:hypothetical protein
MHRELRRRFPAPDAVEELFETIEDVLERAQTPPANVHGWPSEGGR